MEGKPLEVINSRTFPPNYCPPSIKSQNSRKQGLHGHRTKTISTIKTAHVSHTSVFLSSIPKLTLACIIRELRSINVNQPTFVKFHDGSLGATEDPVLIPSQPGTGMVNLRKFQAMADLVHEVLEAMESPSSFGNQLPPEDPQFPMRPQIEEGIVKDWEGIRALVEGAVEGCWGDCVA